jgi:hypothetical protein
VSSLRTGKTGILKASFNQVSRSLATDVREHGDYKKQDAVMSERLSLPSHWKWNFSLMLELGPTGIKRKEEEKEK